MHVHRRTTALLLGLALAACGPASTVAPTRSPSPLATTQPTTAQTASPPSPSPLSQEDALLATMAAAPTSPPTPTTDLPTPFPTITLGPTAAPAPLAAGWWNTATCYEIFVRSFADSDGDGVGDFNGLASKLDYLNDGNPKTTADLGVNCLWLMPVAEADSYHGYDTTDYYNVERDYGTNEQFKTLMAAAHSRGIHVIIDLVLNHTSSAHPWFTQASANPQSPYRDYYIWSKNDPGYSGPWGERVWHPASGGGYFYGIFYEGMPDLNYRNPAVTAEAEKISAFWLNQMDVDGFRLDAIKHLIENGREQENSRETHAWLRAYRSFLQRTKPDSFTVGEIYGAQPGALLDYYPDQLDTYFNFGIGSGIASAVKSGSASELTRPATVDKQIPYQRYAPFLTNHDQTRIMTALGGDSSQMRAAAIALLTQPGIPFLYYGEEIGMRGDKPDERIRTPMQWDAQGKGFSSGTPWEPPQPDLAEVNVAAQRDAPTSLLSLYRALIRQRSDFGAANTATLDVVIVSGSQALAAYTLTAGDNVMLVLLNVGDAQIAGASIAPVAARPWQRAVWRRLPGQPETTAALTSQGDGTYLLPPIAAHDGLIYTLEP